VGCTFLWREGQEVDQVGQRVAVSIMHQMRRYHRYHDGKDKKFTRLII